MTIADLRTAFNDAVRTHQVEAFALQVMPKVFTLLEQIDTNFHAVTTPVQKAARACLDIKLPPKKQPDPARYCGGR